MKTKEEVKAQYDQFKKQFNEHFGHEPSLKSMESFVNESRQVQIRKWTEARILEQNLTWPELELLTAVYNEERNVVHLEMCKRFITEGELGKAEGLINANKSVWSLEVRTELAKQISEKHYIDENGLLSKMTNKQFKESKKNKK